jgi:hypothetical protein
VSIPSNIFGYFRNKCASRRKKSQKIVKKLQKLQKITKNYKKLHEIGAFWAVIEVPPCANLRAARRLKTPDLRLRTAEFSETTSGPRHAETTPQVSQQKRKQNRGFFATSAQAKKGNFCNKHASVSGS